MSTLAAIVLGIAIGSAITAVLAWLVLVPAVVRETKRVLDARASAQPEAVKSYHPQSAHP